uniref:Lipase maturation factor 1 n=1 Tax=uncultured bacterium AOCefta2 TaxID=654977 RepID=D6MLW0_9BACT|nr:lipase maturation factor 1 [uncultured bacterium AOCefta2]
MDETEHKADLDLTEGTGTDAEGVGGASEGEGGSEGADRKRRWRRSYWLTRFIILRWVGLVYFVAFCAAGRQFTALAGEHGLTPSGLFVDRVLEQLGTRGAAFMRVPSLFWINSSDGFMTTLAWIGAALSFVVMMGFANAIMMLVLWALYMSFVNFGQTWYAYGWEMQLLETGMLAAFLCPLIDPRPFPRLAPPTPIIWLFRWLIFRIMLGAGLIKIRGDECWRNCTCLYYHYETQPIPNPISWWLHFRPKWFHFGGACFNHFVELVVPWFGFWPWITRRVAGALMLSFQIILILSGNLSFLNWLTIVPILACFDDGMLRCALPKFLVVRAERAAAEAKKSKWQMPLVWAFFVVVGVLSINPVLNLLSAEQAMNTSFDRLNLVNTYGAFGSVGRVRHEIVFEGTAEAEITSSTKWVEYDFRAKPGDVDRRPVVVAPYQPRLDWAIWFAAMSIPERYPWSLHLVWKLLHNDEGALSLLAGNPFPESPPHYIRAVYYKYEFAPPGDPSGNWWRRTRVGMWLPALSVEDKEFKRFLETYGWLPKSLQ